MVPLEITQLLRPETRPSRQVRPMLDRVGAAELWRRLGAGCRLDAGGRVRFGHAIAEVACPEHRIWLALYLLARTGRLQQASVLNVSESGLQDFDLLAGCARLRELEAAGCSALLDLSGIVGLPALAVLGLARCPHPRDLSPLLSLPALRALDLSDCESTLVDDAGTLLHPSPLIDFAVLQQLRSLERLNLSRLDVLDLDVLRPLSRLTHLTLEEIELLDLSALPAFPLLQELRLAESGVGGCAALLSAPRLSSLDVMGCTLDAPAVVGQLSSLRELRASADTVPHAAGLVGLEVLHLSGVRVPLNLRAFHRLRDLSLAFCSHFPLLPSPSRLERLEIRSSSSVSLPPMPALQALEVWKTPVTGLEAVAGPSLHTLAWPGGIAPAVAARLTGLRALSLSRSTEQADLAWLRGATGLVSLTLLRERVLADLSALSGLSSLRQLYLAGATMTDLHALRGHPALERVWLMWCPALSDVSALASVPSLRFVRVFRCPQVPPAALTALQAALPDCQIG